MEQPEHLTILKLGTEVWNKWRLEHPDIQPKLIATDGEGTNLSQVNLEGANLSQVNLEGADLSESNLKGANLNYANLKGADLYAANLKEAILREADLEEAILIEANLQEADCRRTNLERANLQKALLEKADLRWADLMEADLKWAHLEGVDLYMAQLEGTELQYATFDIKTNLEGIILGDKKCRLASLVNVHWGDADLTVVNWMQLMRKAGDIHEEYSNKRLNEYRLETRACRQLALALESQGLNDEADHFAYRAQIIQRKFLKQQVFSRQHAMQSNEQQRAGLWHRMKKLASYIFSWFLDILAGYGYRPARSFGWYLGVNIICTLAYFFLSEINGFHFICTHFTDSVRQICSAHFIWNEGLEELCQSLAASLTAFHGRGFFPDQFGRGDLRTYIAALEAVFGLFIEASFIATFTSRFYRK